MEAVNQINLNRSDYGNDFNVERIKDRIKKPDLFPEAGNTDFLSMIQNSLNLQQPFLKDVNPVASEFKPDNHDNTNKNSIENKDNVSAFSEIHDEMHSDKKNTLEHDSDNNVNSNESNKKVIEKYNDKSLDKSSENKKISTQLHEKTTVKNTSDMKTKVGESAEVLPKKLEPLAVHGKNSGELLTRDLRNTFNKKPVETKTAAIAIDGIKNKFRSTIAPKMAMEQKSQLNQNIKFSNENKITEKTKSENIKSANLLHKDVKNNNELSKTLEPDVSRETISNTPAEKKIQTSNENVQPKSGIMDKFNIESNLKSNLDSDFSSSQQHRGFSMHTDKSGAMGKVEDNAVLRQNIQQQIDQMMQKARVIIRDNGNASLTTKLNPGELGEISIKLSLIDGKLKGKFTVDNDFVQKELNDKLGKIFADLKTDGYVVDGFQVDVRAENQENNKGNKNFLETVSNEFQGSTRQSITNFSPSMDLDITNTVRRIYA